MIDESALTAAVEAYVKTAFGTSPTRLMPEQHELIDRGTRAAIKAYEAAKIEPPMVAQSAQDDPQQPTEGRNGDA